ncbi:hypothetical protein D031_0638B, partial [Vibrio parahaemolyticus VP-48]
LNPT